MQPGFGGLSPILTHSRPLGDVRLQCLEFHFRHGIWMLLLMEKCSQLELIWFLSGSGWNKRVNKENGGLQY